MAGIDDLARAFLANRDIAMVGVPGTRETGANRNYRVFKEHGIVVIPGSCPSRFLRADLGHTALYALTRVLGCLKVEEEAP